MAMSQFFISWTSSDDDVLVEGSELTLWTVLVMSTRGTYTKKKIKEETQVIINNVWIDRFDADGDSAKKVDCSLRKLMEILYCFL